MGVPAFFRWLTKKYPSVIVDAVEEKPKDADGNRIPVNTVQPNPNFQEFDNLYLDMNGIIHPCTHPEDRPAPKTEDEMFVLIFEYIDRIFAIVRPRRLLYMAIDGVAPRAKMNQQRSRRFRASKEAAEKVAQIDEVRSKLEAEGFPLPPKKTDEAHFDSNCITPGTPFMSRLAVALRYYIHNRLSDDPAWQQIEVILSDANVPGEGEHKIMDFVRRQRALPTHDPNTVHCLCGADADLIMLGLATHEANFNIIREEFIPNQQKPCELCGQYGHELKECRGLSQDEASDCQATPLQRETNFIFVRIPVLREYLEKELKIPNSPISFDLERSIDDWVFMCFFVGNDFLPHLPSLEIRENAIDRLIKLYKEMVYKMKGYLTNSGHVYMERVQMILDGLGEVEDEIFKSRQERELSYRRKAKARRRNERFATRPAYVPSEQSLLAPCTNSAVTFSGSETRVMARDARLEACLFFSITALHYQEARETQINLQNINRKRPHQDDSDLEDEPYDEVRLWDNGWKERYYKSKFEADENDVAFRRKVAWAYVEGLCWVLKYYYQGCVSWNWYFPYHYAPFASDFDTVSQFVPDFSAATEPFKPLQQLMSVFPSASKQHLPQPWQELMTDINSPIIDFYPEDFKVDLNGKKYAWQGVALLPFVDEKRLLETLESVESKLSVEEKERNAAGLNAIFVSAKHPLYMFIQELYNAPDTSEEQIEVALDSSLAYGLAGHLAIDKKRVISGGIYPSPILNERCPDIVKNSAASAVYFDPKFEKGFVFRAERLPGAKEVPKVLKPNDWNPNEPFNPQIGFSRNVPKGRLSDSGHRMLSHQVRQWDLAERSYSMNNYNGEGQYNSYFRVQSFSTFMQTSFRNNNYNQNQERYENPRRTNNYRFDNNSAAGADHYRSNQGSRSGYGRFCQRPSSPFRGIERRFESRNTNYSYGGNSPMSGSDARGHNDRNGRGTWARADRW